MRSNTRCPHCLAANMKILTPHIPKNFWQYRRDSKKKNCLQNKILEMSRERAQERKTDLFHRKKGVLEAKVEFYNYRIQSYKERKNHL